MAASGAERKLCQESGGFRFCPEADLHDDPWNWPAVRPIEPTRFPLSRCLATRVQQAGSADVAITIGRFGAARWAIRATSSPPSVTIKSTANRTKSSASAGRRLLSPAAKAYSIVRFRPSMYPNFNSASRKGVEDPSARVLGGGQYANPEHRACLLRHAADRRHDQRRCNKRRQQHPPPHSMTSSARASSAGGIARPSAFAVLRLITNSNLVGCSTGRSAGLAPLRIFPA